MKRFLIGAIPALALVLHAQGVPEILARASESTVIVLCGPGSAPL